MNISNFRSLLSIEGEGIFKIEIQVDLSIKTERGNILKKLMVVVYENDVF